jgi:hypothetical protein
VCQYDAILDQFRLRFLTSADQDIDAPSAESDILDNSGFPKLVTLNEVGGSGVFGTVTVGGIR